MRVGYKEVIPIFSFSAPRRKTRQKSLGRAKRQKNETLFWTIKNRPFLKKVQFASVARTPAKNGLKTDPKKRQKACKKGVLKLYLAVALNYCSDAAHFCVEIKPHKNLIPQTGAKHLPRVSNFGALSKI